VAGRPELRVLRTVRLVLEYDGTGLAGWQRQANAPTVQQHVEDALATMTKRPVRVTAASRTDAGVHAEGQVAAFRTDTSIPLHGFRRGLNALLPPAIAVVAADEVSAEFNPRFDSRGKHYRYRLWTRPERSPLHARSSWHRPYPLDLAAMRAGAERLVGEHDFSAFRAAGCTSRHAIRRIDRIDIEAGGSAVAVHVIGNAFLRNMVRILAGTLVSVGEGTLTPDQLSDILASRDRTRAGVTAPPQGLTLVRVFYPEP
jgi:tRNA pseudouridine38-40 synthase